MLDYPWLGEHSHRGVVVFRNERYASCHDDQSDKDEDESDKDRLLHKRTRSEIAVLRLKVVCCARREIRYRHDKE